MGADFSRDCLLSQTTPLSGTTAARCPTGLRLITTCRLLTTSGLRLNRTLVVNSYLENRSGCPQGDSSCVRMCKWRGLSGSSRVARVRNWISLHSERAERGPRLRAQKLPVPRARPGPGPGWGLAAHPSSAQQATSPPAQQPGSSFWTRA